MRLRIPASIPLCSKTEYAKEWLDSGIDAPIINNSPATTADKRRLYEAYVKLFADTPNDAPRLAQEAIMRVTNGLSSKECTVDNTGDYENNRRGFLTPPHL